MIHIYLFQERNALLHCVHLWAFSPVWMRECLLKPIFWTNDLSHSGQLYFLTPIWICLCLLRSPGFVVLYSRWLQWFSSSPVWMSECVFKWWFRLNDLLHCGQLCFLTPSSTMDLLVVEKAVPSCKCHWTHVTRKLLRHLLYSDLLSS